MNRSITLRLGRLCARIRVHNAEVPPFRRASRWFSELARSTLEKPIIDSLEDLQYDKVATFSKSIDPSEKLTPLEINSAMAANSMVGRNFSFRPSEDEDVHWNHEDALFMALQRFSVDNSVEGVEMILLRLLDKYDILCSPGDATASLLNKILNGQSLAKRRRTFAVSDNAKLLSASKVDSWISLNSIGATVDALRKSLNDKESDYHTSKAKMERLWSAVAELAGQVSKCRRAKKPVRDDLSVVDSLLSNELLPTPEDVEEQEEQVQVLAEELGEYETALKKAESEYNSTEAKRRRAQEVAFRKEAILRSCQDEYATALAEAGVTSVGTTPLHVWATFLRFYAARNAWKQCETLLEIAEHQHPIDDSTAAGTVERDGNRSVRTHFISMYHDFLMALTRSGQFELVLTTISKMRTQALPVELTAVVAMLNVFGTVTPSASFTVHANNFPLLGRLLLILNEDVVRCVMQVGDRQAHLKLHKAEKLSAKEYREVTSTRGYLTTVNLVEMYMRQLVRLNQFQVAEQMVTFLHENYPQFLTSKGLQPLLAAYKQQGRYDEVVKIYSLWSKGVFKRHQENSLYNVVFESVRLQDGSNMNRSAKFLDSNNPKMDGQK